MRRISSAESAPGAATCGSRRAGPLCLVVLVADLADDLLDEVFECHQPGHIANSSTTSAICNRRAQRVERVVKLQAIAHQHGRVDHLGDRADEAAENG